MKKQIWHIEVEYKWRNIRLVKGIKKPTKEYKTGKKRIECLKQTRQQILKHSKIVK